MGEKEQYVFISYSSKNQQMADSVRHILIEQEIPCWMAPNDIPAGSKYANVINDALENCACLLLLLTNASQESQFVEREIDRAITYNKPIIPMKLEDLQLNAGFKFYIGNSQIIAVPNIDAEAPEFAKVIEGIRMLTKPGHHSGLHIHQINTSVEALPHEGETLGAVTAPKDGAESLETLDSGDEAAKGSSIKRKRILNVIKTIAVYFVCVFAIAVVFAVLDALIDSIIFEVVWVLACILILSIIQYHDLQEEDEDNLYTLKDENGNSTVFELLDCIKLRGEGYFVFHEASKESCPIEVTILHLDDSKKEKEIYSVVEDENTRNEIFEVFQGSNPGSFELSD